MGLYDTRLAQLSESRRRRRVAQRQSQSAPPRRNPMLRTNTEVRGIVPIGRGPRAVAARETKEESMATTRRRRSKKKTAAPKRRRRSRKVAAPKRRRRAKKTAAVTRRRRRRTVRVEAKRSRRRRSRPAAAPKRRRRRVTREAWKGDSAGHATAARKGHRRRKARRSPRRHRRRKASESVVASPRRRRRHKRRSSHVMAKRSHRSYRARASSRNSGMGVGEMVLMGVTGGFGFVLADGLDRMLATYNPSDATKPKDKFTSDGAGTLANTLNVSSLPGWKRVAAGVSVVAVPAVGSMFVKNPYGRGALEGLALGAGISAFKTFWNTVLMPMLVGKDTSVPALQKSYIARLYPTEVAAHLNKKQAQTSVSSSGSGALSGAPDVGPFALAGDSPYPDAGQALRSATGVHGDSPYPDAAQALRAGVGGDSQYPSAAQALRREAGMGAGPTPTGGPDSSWNPGPPPGSGPGPQAQPHKECGCIGEDNAFLGFVGGAPEEDTLFNATAQ